jgi:hypothetical protein
MEERKRKKERANKWKRERMKERVILNGRVGVRYRERELKIFYILIQFWHSLR